MGRHPDDEIAISLEWTDDPEILIKALVRCRLLDRSEPPERLLVHDWPQHAPRHVRATLHRLGLDWSAHYASCHDDMTTDATTDRSAEDSTGSSVVRTTSTSSSSSAIASTYTNTNTNTNGDSDGEKVSIHDLACRVWNTYVPGRKQGKKPGIVAIEDSIRKVAQEYSGNLTLAAEHISRKTEADCKEFMSKLGSGETELRFIPQGSTYFKQERWADDNEEIDGSEITTHRIRSEIARARSNPDLG